ncbi:MAG: hypothetical protein B5M56_09610 [Desulfococcus sp. 4484_241]|nr:MAG: hypothetical protein B5M56_09610 [Desulfococcus sp. 4484_241]
MRPDQLYHELKSLAEKLGITVKEHNLRNAGIHVSSGLCRVNDQMVFVMDKRLPIREKTANLAECLGGMNNIDDVYMVPALRDLIVKYKNKTEQN